MISVYRFVCNAFAENSFLLFDHTGECIFIDPGFDTEAERKALSDFVREQKLKPKMIALTHGHLDHVWGSLWLSRTYTIPMAAHPNEAMLLQYAPAFAQRYGFSMEMPPNISMELQEGELLRFGESELRMLHVPGHSPGSIVFYCEAQGFCIAGDVLFKESIGRSDLPGGNHEQLVSGIREKLMVLPENTLVYPGHGDTTTIGHEKAFNPFL